MSTVPSLVIPFATVVLAGCNVAANNREAIRQADIAIVRDVYGPGE